MTSSLHPHDSSNYITCQLSQQRYQHTGNSIDKHHILNQVDGERMEVQSVSVVTCVQQTYAKQGESVLKSPTNSTCLCCNHQKLMETTVTTKCCKLVNHFIKDIGANMCVCKDLLIKYLQSLRQWSMSVSSQSGQYNTANSHSNNSVLGYQGNTFMMSLFLQVFFILCISTSSVGAQTWEAIPRNSSAILGGTVQLNCGVRNLTRGSVFSWLIHNDDQTGTRILFLNDQTFDPKVPSRYSVTPHPSDGGNVQGYDLVLSGLQQEDDKIYECNVQNMNDGRKQAKVTVLVEPGFPIITSDKDLSSLTARDKVKLNCSTSGGNPQPIINWYRNDVKVNGAKVTPPSGKFGTTESTLTWDLTKDDHEASFKCTVTNEAIPGQTIDTVKKLSVKFAPVITVGLYNPLHSIEGSDVKLQCSVVANPAVTNQDVEWINPLGSRLGKGFEHTLLSVQATQSGTYRCEATNAVNTSTANLVLDVQYPPKVTIAYSHGVIKSTNQLHVTEKQPLNLTCQVDANPAVHVNTIEWRKGSSVVHTGPYYYIPLVNRADTAEYNCTARNTLTPSGGSNQQQFGSGSLQVFVQYPPGRASITLPSVPIKNKDAELKCDMDDFGFPTAQLRWTVLGSATILGTGPKLLFTPLKLHNTADYICTPINDIGEGTPDSKRLNVLELPEWIETTLPPKVETSINTTDLSLRCEVRGNPQPRVLWYQDGLPLDSIAFSDLYTITEYVNRLEMYSWNVTSILKWKGSRRRPTSTSLLPPDSGTYKCQGVNDLDPTGIKATTELFVYYPPVIGSPSHKVAVAMNNPATLQCKSHSLPDTTFQWYNGTQKLTHGGRIQIENTVISGDLYPFWTTLTIANVNEYDFGDYQCVGSNSQGSNNLQINLTVKTVPDAPKNLFALTTTWESVQLSWEAGFNGGYPQTYTIAYVSGKGKSGQIDGLTKLYHNVTLLYPSTFYTFVVYGKSELGNGKTSNQVKAKTLYFYIEPPTNVEYDPNTYTVSFNSPSSHYCARIDTYNGKVWSNYEPCAPTTGGQVKITQDLVVDGVHVALCLETRQDVCSDNNTAVMLEQEDDLPTYVVILIGVICAIIVITLLVVLIVLCLKRRQSAKDEEESNKPTATVKPQQGNGQLPAVHRPQQGNGQVPTVHRPQPHMSYDNPSLDKSHSPVDERMNNSVFTTETSQGTYDFYNGQPPNGAPPNHHHQQQQQPYHYDNNTNVQRERSFKTSGRDMVDGRSRHPSDKPYLYLDDPYRNPPKDHHNNSGEGSTSSDQKPPPKKVMYEVVV